jgi:hypothetical protein
MGCRVGFMRRLLILIAISTFLAVADVASGAGEGGRGVVQRSWASKTSGGAAVTSLDPASARRIYANFVWRTPPNVNQALRIGWKDPTGVIRAVWTARTVASDKKGTRIFAWIGASVLKAQSAGRWQVILTVGGVTRNVQTFRTVAAPISPAPSAPNPSPPANGGCDPNYKGACVPIVGYDLNCADIGAMVQVVGSDPNRFDADGDGYGCESYG